VGSSIRSKLTYANVVALALFLALGGGAVAAVTLSRNSVKSKHIAKGQVKRSDIGKNAVTSAKVKAGSLFASDFKVGQLPQGPKGDQGEPGVARVAATMFATGNVYRGSLAGGSVRHAATGQYCVDLPFVPVAASVARSTDVLHPQDRDSLVVVAVGPEVTCVAGEDLLVTVLEIDEDDNGTIDNTFVDRGFSLIAN
jgi:hypothetical protein